MSSFRRIGSRAIIAALAVSAAASPALACPSCPTATVVRASVFDERFWAHLGALALPLLVLGAICALLYRVDARPRRRAGSAHAGKVDA